MATLRRRKEIMILKTIGVCGNILNRCPNQLRSTMRLRVGHKKRSVFILPFFKVNIYQNILQCTSKITLTDRCIIPQRGIPPLFSNVKGEGERGRGQRAPSVQGHFSTSRGMLAALLSKKNSHNTILSLITT